MAVRNPILVCNDVAHVTNEFTKVWMNSKRRAKHFANNNSQHQQLGNICKAIWNQNNWLQCIPKMRLTARKNMFKSRTKSIAWENQQARLKEYSNRRIVSIATASCTNTKPKPSWTTIMNLHFLRVPCQRSKYLHGFQKFYELSKII